MSPENGSGIGALFQRTGMIKKIRLPKFVEEILKRLEDAGYKAYGIGGCVRNPLMGLSVSDYDVTTSAGPEEIKRVFEGMKILETGIKHGTVTVISERGTVEITAFRTDGEYKDFRHPENVSFTRSLEEDLKRRDFTVNAIACSRDGAIIDPYNGIGDIETMELRCVGDAEKRFEEDALRIMRGLRFMALYGFLPESGTKSAIHKKKNLLKEISPERLSSELTRILCGNAEYLASVLREYSDVFSVIIPEINKCVGFEQHTHYHDRDVWEHTIAALCGIEPIPYLRLAMLFHDLGKPFCYKFYNGEGHFKGHASVSGDICRKTMEKLRYDGATIKKTLFLVERHDMVMNDDPIMIKKHLMRFGEEGYFDLLKVHIADDYAKARVAMNRIPVYNQAKSTAENILKEKECFSLKNLEVNGNDIVKMGYKGADIGKALDFLLNAVIEEKCLNTHDELIIYLKENNNKLFQ